MRGVARRAIFEGFHWLSAFSMNNRLLSGAFLQLPARLALDASGAFICISAAPEESIEEEKL